MIEKPYEERNPAFLNPEPVTYTPQPEPEPEQEQFTEPPAEHEKSPSMRKELKKRATADIEWRSLAKTVGLALLVSYLASGAASILSSALSAVSPAIGALVGILTTVGLLFLTAFLTAGITDSFFQSKRRHQITGAFGSSKKTVPVLKVLLLRIVYIGVWILAPAIIPIVGAVLYGSAGTQSIGSILMTAGAVLYIPGLVMAVRAALTYALALYLNIDKGLGAKDSMHTSKELMTGCRLLYLGLLLSFMGWILLEVFAASVLISLPLIPAFISGSISLIGGIFWVISASVTMLVLLIPLYIYIEMTRIEFYEERLGVEPFPARSRSSRNIVLAPLLVSLIIAVIAIALMMFPTARIPLASVTSGDFTPEQQEGDLSGYGEKVESEVPPEKVSALTPEEPDDIQAGVTDKTKNEYYVGRLVFAIPSGYVPSGNSSDTKSVFVNDDDKQIVISRKSESKLDTYKEKNEGGKDAKYSGIAGYEEEEEKEQGTIIYRFVCENEGSLFFVEATDKKAYEKVLGTIHF